MDEVLSKINRITVQVDMEEDEAIINLYKTNQLIGRVEYQKIDILSPRDSELSIKAYCEYAKDVMINLIENGGLNGFYYEEKQKIEGIKFGMSEFRSGTKDFISKILDEIEFTMTGNDTNQLVEQYGDGFIKNATVDFGIAIKDIRLQVRSEIKSGQLCRPRTMIYDGEEQVFNITNVKHIMKGR